MIHIKDIKGVFTNADHDDISPEYVSELINFRPINGKLVKTFGCGLKTTLSIEGYTDYSVKNIIMMEKQGAWVYLLVLIDPDTNNVKLMEIPV